MNLYRVRPHNGGFVVFQDGTLRVIAETAAEETAKTAAAALNACAVIHNATALPVYGFLARYDYNSEPTRSDALTKARGEYSRRKAAGERVQYRHIDDNIGTAYVVEMLS